MQALVKLSGVPEDMLEKLVKKGYFKTKTEAIRAGLLELGQKYELLGAKKDIEMELVALKIKSEAEELRRHGISNIPEGEVKAKYGFK